MIKQLLSLITLLALNLSVFAQSDQDVLMTVAGNPVTVEEFRYIYEKNNGEKANYSKNSLREYINLYTNFKLKVAKAKDLKMDTIQSLKEELAGYKRQLANSYLMDKEVLAHLVNELYERMATDQDISHIYVKSDRKTSSEDDKKAYEKITEAKKALDEGMSFSDAAKKYSEDTNNKDSAGRLGYFTAMMPSGYYQLENAMYNTPAGSHSEVIKTKIGYHIVKVEGSRPARGRMNLAHILIKKTTPKAKVLADQIYNDLVEGMDWENGVTKFSQDTKTNKNGGKLPELGINMYDLKFEDAAFALQNDGDISQPIQTEIGWHILKRINRIERLDFPTFKKVYESKIKKDERYEQAKEDLIEDIKKAGDYQRNEKLFQQFVSTVNDTFLTYKWQTKMGFNSDETLLSFGGNTTHTLNEFKDFCRKNTKTRLRYDKTATKPAEVVDIIYKDFVKEKAIDFEQSNLEVKYADFRSLMREYEEGILLFEVTKDAVWDKANEDTTGLKEFYEIGKYKYKTDPLGELNMLFIETDDKKLATKIDKYINKKGYNKAVSKFNKKNEIVSSLTEALEKNNDQFKGMEWVEGATTGLVYDEKAKRFTRKTLVNILPPQTKPMNEVRGYIVADYQDYLEREWLKALKKEYKVELNQAVVDALMK